MKPIESTRRIRVLHIVGGMNRGGVETWLMHVLRHIDRERFQMDFMVHTTAPCAYDNEVRGLGGRILPCLRPDRPWIYARNFRRILGEYGPYDIIHSHLQSYSGFTLRLAHRTGIPVRIAHSHNDLSSADRSLNPFRRIYLATTERWLRKYATIGLAPSATAAKALFGPQWRSDSRWSLLYYGIDLEPFRAAYDPGFRATLQIPVDAFIIGHIGRFVEQKNHRFLLQIARRVLDREPKTYLLLVGDGPLRPAVERQAAKMGFGDHIIFAGLRSDIARVLISAVDVFVLPSLYEGLGMVGLEAQAAGLPCIVSDTVPEELDVLPQLTERLPLSLPAFVWAGHVTAWRRSRQPVNHLQAQALETLAHGPFNVSCSVRHLESLYQRAVGQNGRGGTVYHNATH